MKIKAFSNEMTELHVYKLSNWQFNINDWLVFRDATLIFLSIFFFIIIIKDASKI